MDEITLLSEEEEVEFLPERIPPDDLQVDEPIAEADGYDPLVPIIAGVESLPPAEEEDGRSS